MVWDFLKCDLRGITIEYSIKKAKRTRQYVNELTDELKKLESKLDNNKDVSDAYNTIRNELEQIEEEKLRGHMIRSRAQWIEEGEKCTKYFMQLENKNYKTKCLTTLSKNDHKITEQTDILEECKTFYKQLYSETIVENNFENCRFLQQNTRH